MCTIHTAASRYVSERFRLGEFSPVTARNTRYLLFAFARSLDNKAIGRVRRKDVEGWLMRSTSGTNTKYSNLCTLRAFTKWCLQEGYLHTDPCFGIKGPRRSRGNPRNVAPAGVAAILSRCDERTAVAVLLGVQEGLRRAEIAGLSTSDVDTDAMLLRVLGKGQKERWVPLSDETLSAIDEYLTVHPAGPHVPLLRSYTSPTQGLLPGTVGELVVRAMKAAGVKRKPYDGKSAHALRHSCANDMLDHGADLRDVSEMLGHSDLAVTASVYANRVVAMGRLRTAAAGRSYSGHRQTPADHSQ